jgi:uncharacterized membrane protein YhaH (DUF805 family)
MNLFEAVKTCWAKYATFSGRASRSEYWFIILFFWLLMFVTAIIDVVVFPDHKYMVINLTANLLIVIPSISVAARRLHDVNRSGWWQLLYITFVGIIPLLYWFIKKGDDGDNKHGSNPLQTLNEYENS